MKGFHSLFAFALFGGHYAIALSPSLAYDLGISDVTSNILAESIEAIGGFSADVDDTQRAKVACLISRTVFSLDNSTSGTDFYSGAWPGYQGRVDANWSDNCWQNATCIVSPRTAKGISDALRIVNYTATRFSVRSGGHNFNVNYSSVATGILIDLVNLNEVVLSHDKTTVSLGPGSTFGSVFRQLNGSGVSINGARDPSPGVGGVYLGGGSGFFAGTCGMSAGSIQSFEVVLANSSIVTASPHINKDLFWALKGGGPNFGIVSRYTVVTIPTPFLWYQVALYNSTQNAAIFDAIVAFQAAIEHDDNANLAFQLTPAFTLLGFIYTKPIERPSVFSMFYNLPIVTSLANSTIGTESQLAEVFASSDEKPVRHAGVSVAHRPDLHTYRESFAVYLNLSAQVTRFGGTLAYGIQPFNSNAMKRTLQGGSPLGVTVVNQNWFVGAITWPDEEDDTAALDAVQALGNAVAVAAKRNGVYLPFQFMNDANHLQDVFASYGNDSFTRLLAVSKKYDAAQVFQKLQNGGWLLTKSSLYKE